MNKTQISFLLNFKLKLHEHSFFFQTIDFCIAIVFTNNAATFVIFLTLNSATTIKYFTGKNMILGLEELWRFIVKRRVNNLREFPLLPITLK